MAAEAAAEAAFVLFNLPEEVVCIIVSHADLRSLARLGRCCQRLRRLAAAQSWATQDYVIKLQSLGIIGPSEASVRNVTVSVNGRQVFADGFNGFHCAGMSCFTAADLMGGGQHPVGCYARPVVGSGIWANVGSTIVTRTLNGCAPPAPPS